jgi:thiol-disulfide isomerase/thioredoxin
MAGNMNRSVLVFPLLIAGLALATGDPRGWSEGQAAANAATYMARAPLGEVEFPKAFAKSLKRPTLVVYFSPTCPHCRHVAPELGRLASQLGKRADLVMVASSSTPDSALEEWRTTFGATYRIVKDEARAIGNAMGIRSTPSGLLLQPSEGGSTFTVIDAYYPFAPGYSALVEMRLAEPPFAAFTPNVYQGTVVCATCHTQEAESWAVSHHAIAWRTLVVREEHENPECIGCHVVGYEQESGWSAEERPHLSSVGCEACHGPGGPHDGVEGDARASCEGCHDAKHSIAFSVEKGLPHIDHFVANGMSDEEYRARREALGSGEAPKPLLAFEQGTNVGSEACVSCHEAEVAAWKDSPHAAAMDSLAAPDEQRGLAAGEASTTVACVRCHTTAKTSGAPPDKLEGYHLEEGVSCESCHGPGEAHVAAGGGTDNIEGLGEDCPVCVIEAVCTSCHTREWDPTWDLDTHLPRVGHGGR